MAVNEENERFEHPLYGVLEQIPGGGVGLTTVDRLLTWGVTNAMWVFPMATSCCGIEFMAAACSRFDLDRIGTIARGSPRQCDVMVVAGTITVKMAPRVKRLWDEMPEPKWVIAMGSCAISGDFYRDIYSVVPGIDTFLPVDIYVPGCPPNPDQLLMGLHRLKEKIERRRRGEKVDRDPAPPAAGLRVPFPRMDDPNRDPGMNAAQLAEAMALGKKNG